MWASAVAYAVIIDPSRGKWSMDPLRVFGPVRGAEVAASVLMPLLQIQPDDDFGVTLTTVLSRVVAASAPPGVRSGVRCGVGEKLGVYIDKSYAALRWAA